MTNQPSRRRFELDWIRVLAFILLILFHTGMMFNTWDWHVKNNVTISWIETLMNFLHQWRMPILFFISGCAVWFMMDKYSSGRFIAERHKRLLIPLVFGMFVIIPPQVYYERLFQGQDLSFAHFYMTVLQLIPYPAGNFSWHHLWYIPYIFVFSLIMFPAFRFFKSATGDRILKQFDSFFSRGGRVYFLFLPMAVSEIILRPFWPDNANNLFGDWAQFTTMILVFTLGFMIANATGVWDRLATKRRLSLMMAVASFAVLSVIWEMDLGTPPMWMMIIYRLLRMLNMWLWITALLGFARQHLKFSNRFLAYANEAVYPFYILHQTITVIVGYYLAPLDMSVFAKFLILAVATFGGSWILLEGLIRPIGPLRICMGLKWRSGQSIASGGPVSLLSVGKQMR